MSREKTYASVRRLALGAAVLAAGWAVAPAFSLERYTPTPVNFEQAVPEAQELGPLQARRSPGAQGLAAGGEDGEGRVRFLTDPISAPARFDLVGIVGHREEVELRVRGEEGWSPWVESSDGEPLWAGGAEQVQLRAREEEPEGKLAYVNVSGTATGRDRALSGVRGAVNSAFVSVASMLGGATASAEPPFDVVTRSGWDPNRDCVPKKAAYGKVRGAVVHHTVNPNSYSRAEASRMVLGICRYHRYSHGWNDIGYNALVDRFGTIYAGRAGGLDRAVVGAHTAGFNSQMTGISSLGTHTSTGMRKPALRAMARFLSWKFQVHGIPATGKARLVSTGGSGNKHASGKRLRTRRIVRHRRFNETSCPGRAQVKKVLRKVKRRIAAGRDQPVEPVEPPPEDDGGGGIAPG